MSQRKFSRAILVSSLLCVVALLVAACGGGNPSTSPSTNALTPAPPDKQVLHYPIGSNDFGSLDPALVAASTDIFAVETIFTGLVEIKSDGSIVDVMAASHQVSSDGLSYTFVLKPNVTFSDGTPLTAQDVAYSVNRALLPDTKAPLASFLSAIKDFDQIFSGKVKTLIGDSIVVQDDHTLIIKLAKPTPSFLASFAFPVTFPVNKKLIDQYGVRWTDHLSEGAGAGPFQVQSYDHAKGLTLVANPKYYGAKAKLQKIIMARSGDQNTTFRSYKANQVDIAEIPADNVASFKGKKDYKFSPALAIAYLSLNYLAKPFNNIKIRQAFALSIDKDLIAQNVMKGTVIPTNHLIPQGMPGYNQSLVGPAGVASTKGDTAKAKALFQQGMQEEGYSDVSKLPDLSIAYYSDAPNGGNLMAVITQQWQQVLGVTVHVDGMSLDNEIQKMTNTTGKSGPLQMWYLEYGGLADPQSWLSVIFGKAAAFNNQNYGQNNSANAAAQQAVQNTLAQADVNLNPQERLQQYDDAEQKLVEDVAWISLYQAEYHFAVNAKLQNFPIGSVGIFEPDAWSTIYFVQ